MKTALIIAHYGTTYQGLKEKVIDRFQDILNKELKDISIYQLYTSTMIRKLLMKQGIEIESIEERIDTLISEGYTKIFVQPTYLSFGREMNNLINSLEKYKERVDLRIGVPLIDKIEDCFNILEIINKEEAKTDREATVLIGHGFGNSSLSLYTTLDCIAKEFSKNIHIGVISGYPTQNSIIKKLKSEKIERVTIIPLLFLAGQHMKKDIEVDWKENFQSNGFEVEIKSISLGERDSVLNLIKNRIKSSLEADEN